jgi:hypothetical protein
LPFCFCFFFENDVDDAFAGNRFSFHNSQHFHNRCRPRRASDTRPPIISFMTTAPLVRYLVQMLLLMHH